MSDALKVAIDVLEEHGADKDIIAWLRHPEAVRRLLTHRPRATNRETDEGECPSCGVYNPHDYQAGHQPHYQQCEVAADWRLLGDPRGDFDPEFDHARAIHEYATEMRIRALGPDPHPSKLLGAIYSSDMLDAMVYANNPLFQMMPRKK